MTITRSHLAAVSLALSGLATMIGGLPDWSTAVEPAFISGALLMVSSLGFALSGEPVQGRKVFTSEERAAAQATSATGIFKLWK
jgi:hypothetical protein